MSKRSHITHCDTDNIPMHYYHKDFVILIWNLFKCLSLGSKLSAATETLNFFDDRQVLKFKKNFCGVYCYDKEQDGGLNCY